MGDVYAIVGRHRHRSAGKERRGCLKNQVMIDQRPPIVEERTRIGDWEMDTVIGRTGGPVLVTMVERRSRCTLIRLVPSKEAAVVTAAILEATKPYRDKVLSHTYDNGKEFAMHELLTEIMEAQAYFAHPYHSWERGLNENTNGLIRPIDEIQMKHPVLRRLQRHARVLRSTIITSFEAPYPKPTTGNCDFLLL